MLTHAERVAAAVPDRCKIVALLHDAIEDGHITLETATGGLASPIVDALWLLTRRDTDTYAEYIDRIHHAATTSPTGVGARAACAGQVARTVKIADLHDNLHCRPEGPPPGDLKARYEKALAILEGDQA